MGKKTKIQQIPVLEKSQKISKNGKKTPEIKKNPKKSQKGLAN